MRCSSCEPVLDAYLEGSLGPFRARSVARHLERCERCAALLAELRVVDALLTTARSPRVAPDFTATVVSAAQKTPTKAARRAPVGLALLLYLALAWTLAAILVGSHGLGWTAVAWSQLWQRDGAALGAAMRALAPATPVAAATGVGVLLVDVVLLAALFYGYRRIRPLLAGYLSRGDRS
jgi:anti-sigma factor RsiW